MEGLGQWEDRKEAEGVMDGVEKLALCARRGTAERGGSKDNPVGEGLETLEPERRGPREARDYVYHLHALKAASDKEKP